MRYNPHCVWSSYASLSVYKLCFVFFNLTWKRIENFLYLPCLFLFSSCTSRISVASLQIAVLFNARILSISLKHFIGYPLKMYQFKFSGQSLCTWNSIENLLLFQQVQIACYQDLVQKGESFHGFGLSCFRFNGCLSMI